MEALYRQANTAHIATRRQGAAEEPELSYMLFELRKTFLLPEGFSKATAVNETHWRI